MKNPISSILVRFRIDKFGNLVARIVYRTMRNGQEVYHSMETPFLFVRSRVDEVVRKHADTPILFRYES
jgi:hypothetical protein